MYRSEQVAAYSGHRSRKSRIVELSPSLLLQSSGRSERRLFLGEIHAAGVESR